MMGAPPLEVSHKSLGRFGEFTVRCEWTTENSDDLEGAVLLDITQVSGKYTNTRFGITKLEWVGPEVASVSMEFDALPATPDRIIAVISAGAGEICFEDWPNGCIADPERDSPSNVVLNSIFAVPGDVLFIKGTYIEKGTRPA